MSGEADQVKLLIQAESTYGVHPTGNPKFDTLRFVSESLAQNLQTVQSAEITSDRQVSNMYRTAADVSGDINFELSYGGVFEEILAAVLCSAGWSSEVSHTNTTFAAVASGNKITGSSLLAIGFEAGQWILVSGFTNEENNGFFKLESVSNSELALSGRQVVDEGAGQSVTVLMGSQITNGTTSSSFTIERQYTDLSNEIARFAGCMFDGMSLDLSTEAIVTGSFQVLGKRETSGTATLGDGSPTAATTNEVIETVEDIPVVVENGSSIAVTKIQFNLANNLRKRSIIGELGPDSVGKGTCVVTGSMEAYFATKTLYDKYLNFQATSLGFVCTDDDGNSYVFEFPTIKFSSGSRGTQGQNTDIVTSLDFQSLKDASESITIRIAKFPAS